MASLNKKKASCLYICQQCGYQSIKWLGRCPDCGAWESLIEEVPKKILGTKATTFRAIPLAEAPDGDEERISTTLEELDRVLGGGIVPGSVILIGGEPGIGKSTLILHMLAAVAAGSGRKVLYVSGEESARQIKMRARRLAAIHQDEYLATGNEVEEIIALTEEMRPCLLAVDSIQTLVCADLPSAPGSVSQVRESAYRLLTMAKKENIPIVLVGHVTKDGYCALETFVRRLLHS